MLSLPPSPGTLDSSGTQPSWESLSGHHSVPPTPWRAPAPALSECSTGFHGGSLVRVCLPLSCCFVLLSAQFLVQGAQKLHLKHGMPGRVRVSRGTPQGCRGLLPSPPSPHLSGFSPCPPPSRLLSPTAVLTPSLLLFFPAEHFLPTRPWGLLWPRAPGVLRMC